MAIAKDKIEDSEKAFAEAASGSIDEKAVEKAVKTDAPKAKVKPAAVAKAVAADKKSALKKKAAAKKKPAAKRKAAPKKKAATKSTADVTIPSLKKKAAKTTNTKKPTVSELKETIMAKAKKTDAAETVKNTVSNVQERAQTAAKTAFEKSSALASEATEFTKGNVEAMVESGKILASGMQDMGKVYVEEVKGAYETATTDMKEMASVKSPTDLFQLQGKIARRNFDHAIAFGSKNTEMMVKIANDAFAPISNRVSVAAEKISKVA